MKFRFANYFSQKISIAYGITSNSKWKLKNPFLVLISDDSEVINYIGTKNGNNIAAKTQYARNAHEKWNRTRTTARQKRNELRSKKRGTI